MKQLTSRVTYKTLLTFLMLTFIQVIVWAQDNSGTGGSGGSSNSSSSTSVTKTTTTTDWYTQPWVWVVGGVILIILLVLLTRGNSGAAASRTDRVTVTKTRDTDVV